MTSTDHKLAGQYTDLEKKRDDVVLYLCGVSFLVAVIYSVFSDVLLTNPPWWFASLLILILASRSLAEHGWMRVLSGVLAILAASALGVSMASQAREQQLAQRWTMSQDVVAVVRVVGLSDGVGTAWRQVVEVQTPLAYQGQRWLVSLPYGKTPQTNTPIDRRFRAGQYWQMRLQVKPIRGVASPHAFDVERWLLTRHIVAQATLQHAQWQSDHADLLDQVQRLRASLRQTFERLDSPEYGVLLGLLTGDRALIHPDQQHLYQQVGISHLLAISGPHVLLLAAIGVWGLTRILNQFPRLYLWQPRPKLLLPVWWGMVAAYALLAGFEIPAQRTLAMATVFVMTMYLQKHLNVMKSLLIIAVVMVCMDPLMLWSAAFWLSYGAVALLLCWSMWHQIAPTQQVSGRQHLIQQLRQLTQVQALMTVGLLPLILVIFGQLSWLSLPVNLIAIPLLGVLIVGLNLLGLLVWLIHVESAVWVWSVAQHILLLFHTGIAGLVDIFPHALMPWRLDVLAVGVLAVWVGWWLLPKGIVPRWSSVLLLPLLLCPRPQPPLTVQVLDVGQGLSVLISTPKHRMLFDTGTARMTKQVVLPALYTIGRPQLDLVMLSHADQDHAGGALLLLDQTRVARWQLGQPLAVFEKSTPTPCVSGQSWQWDGVQFEVLAPFATGWSDLADNDQSCVLKITTAPDAQGRVQRVLIMGDAGHVTEQTLLLMCADVRADVLLVGHHGSRTSSSISFIQAVQPQRAVISAGYANRFGHPHAEVLKNLQTIGVQIDSTIHSGTLTYQLGEGAALEPQRHRAQWSWLHW